jgi:hypothetical protein
MADTFKLGLVYVMAVALVLAPIEPAYAASTGLIEQPAPNATSAAPPNQLGPITDSEMQSYGCLATAGGGLVLVALAGHDELLAAIAGGGTTPTTAAGVVVTAIVLVSASFCAVGALATPGVVRMWRYYYLGMRPTAVP